MSNRLQLRIADKIRETSRSTTLVLEPVNAPVSYRAGQFLTFIFDRLGPTQIRRSYSLSSAPGVEDNLAITVKKVPNGAVSRYLSDSTELGTLLEALPPAGRFILDPTSAPRDIFLIGGGSGVTPLFSLLKQTLHDEPQSRVILIDANHDETCIIFKKQLQALAKHYAGRFVPILYLSNPKRSISELRQQLSPLDLHWGRLSNALIEQLVQQHLQHPPERARFFLCGPQGLIIKAENTLGFLGFGDKQVHREIFTIKTVYRPEADNFPHSQVRLRINGDSYQFPVLPGQHILEAARRAGIELPYSCLSGICTTCSVNCSLGEVEMYTQEGLLTTEMTDGLVLTCVGYPTSEVVELEA